MRIVRGLFMAGLVVLVGACSGGEEPQEPVEVDDVEADIEEAVPAEAMEEAAAEPAPPEMEAEVDAAVSDVAAMAPAEPAGFDGPAVTRYVTSVALNVRTGPGKEHPVKRHVKWGDKLDVVINGEWAKLAPGEYVSVNRLSPTMPKKK